MAPNSSASHKKRAIRPQLTVPTTTSVMVSWSVDQRRTRMHTGAIDQVPRSPSPDSSRWWAEDLVTAVARRAEEFSYALGDDSLSSQADDWVDDGIDMIPPPVVKGARTEYRPLKEWYAYNDEYLYEQLRRESRGSPRVYSQCASRHGACLGTAELRCVDQACTGEVMHCAACVVAAHAQLPTHFLEKWTGTHFERKRNWLQILGLRIQLNHPPGVVCPFRHAAPKDFVLYDFSGVHEINVDFCGCLEADGKVLPDRQQFMHACWWPATVKAPNTCATWAVCKFFQILNCLSKLSAYNFLRGLERCTNHDGLDKPLHAKRFKRGHHRGGMRATKQGELTVKCRQCPRPDYNIPDDWDQIEPAYWFIYFIFLAQDANFRLSNRSISSELADPILGDGFGYFCRQETDEGYKAHIEKHVKDEEISNLLRLSSHVHGKYAPGEGTADNGDWGRYVLTAQHVVPERHWRPSAGGKVKNCNMDFLLVSVLMTITLLWVVVSYDIAGQYAIHFWDQVAQFPEPMRLTHLAPSNVWWKVPNFHLPAHKKPCHLPYSFHWMWGAGMTHGEGVEQNWAFSNGAAASTRLMGPGARVAALEDVFGFHNYDRQLAMREAFAAMDFLIPLMLSRLDRILPKCLAVNIKEGLKHRAAFEEFSSGLEALRPNEVAEWRAWVLRWEATQHMDAADSPFELVEEVTTLRAIQLEIAEEEFICTDDGVEVEQEHSPGSFVSMGLALEEEQRKLAVDVKALKDPSITQRLAFTKRRTTLLKQIHKFRQIQRIYMPAVRAILTDVKKQMYDGNGEQLPECTRLFMPSEISNDELRGKACAIGLPQVEARMREGEAMEALEAVRHGLRTRTMTNRYKLRNYTGQGAMTRGQGILRQINVRIHHAKLQYRYARAALLVVQGHGSWEEALKVLDDDGVRALNERALTLEEKAQNEHWAELGGAVIEGGVARAAGLAAGEGRHHVSWIWYTPGLKRPGSDESDSQLVEALHVEWCKAFSRARRFAEDVRILHEEMDRTIESGYTEAEIWDALVLVEPLADAPAELTEGRRAYAAEHAATERKTVALLEGKWAGILDRADAFLGGETVRDVAVTIELEADDKLDPEEEEGRLEAEEEEG
ncbi:hypothetical protein C8R43DRAFT_946025 [Mycena crocata]|nr:hypothetical protein C8R43DRAFT_946025 [Mycena crocata]